MITNSLVPHQSEAKQITKYKGMAGWGDTATPEEMEKGKLS